MVRQARAMIHAGAIGEVRLVEGQFAGGEPGVLREPANPAERHWRFRASIMGRASVLGEVGSHAHNIVEYVTGQRVVEVSARLSTVATGREVYDNAYLTVDFDGGAVGDLVKLASPPATSTASSSGSSGPTAHCNGARRNRSICRTCVRASQPPGSPVVSTGMPPSRCARAAYDPDIRRDTSWRSPRSTVSSLPPSCSDC